ncbi:MAG: helix-turn-helix domain-containing protein [Planctomycetales bacterium]|nr:helix-turn-helix domain-containing protein [Planctomycetales bacterium]
MAEVTEPLAVGIAKAAELLSVSRRKMHDLTQPRGPIRAVRIGRDRRYPIDELRRFLRDGMPESSK